VRHSKIGSPNDAVGQLRRTKAGSSFARCPLCPESGQEADHLGMPAKCHVWTAPSWQGFSSRLQAGRCSHVFGLLARHTRPLAIMPSADQVPVKSPHSTMQWHMWVVLIAGSTGSALRAVRPPNLHITPNVGAISVTPQVRRVPCSDHPWPSWPTPFLRSCWQVRSRPPWWAAAPTMP
jgi:hypothetical protein